jgi:preprotein translocase subunit SecF
MELFKEPKIDFLGRRKYFLVLSLLLFLAGAVSLGLRGGPRFGIDFKGGTLVYIKFKEEPNVDQIRAALTGEGLAVATLQPFEEGPDDHELKIDLDLIEEEELASGKDQIYATLRTLYGGDASKLDFNNFGPESMLDRMMANQKVAESPLTTAEIQESLEALVAFRDQPPQSGLVREFSELTSVPGVNPDIIAALQEEAYLGAFAIRGGGYVGPKIGKELQWQAVKATLFALGGMLIYIAFRFEWIYGVAAVVAVFHDILITLGFFSLFDREIELTVIAAFLTLVGYSMNDTIVIFDRVRENRKLNRRLALERLVNLSVNQTLARTVLTSGLTLVAVLCLFLFAGEVLRGFSFALLVGVIVGTYSSVFIASPVLLWWQGVAEARGGRGRRRR